MRKSALDVSLEKVSAGDLSYLSKLCAQLTDRLCYLPVLKVQKDSRVHRVEVIRLTKNAGQFVPLFTNEKRFEEWRETQGDSSFDSIDILGGDLCSVLGTECGVIVDPGSDHTVELGPDVVQKIATQVQQKSDEEFEATRKEQAQTSVSQTSGVKSVYEEVDPHSTLHTEIPPLVSRTSSPGPTDTAIIRGEEIEKHMPQQQGGELHEKISSESLTHKKEKRGFLGLFKGKK